MRRGFVFALVFGFSALASPSAFALTLEPIGAFENPVYVTSDPADPDRLLVVESEGRVVLVEGGVARPFLDIAGEVLTTVHRGMFSIALAPDYASSGRLYVVYSREAPEGDPTRGAIQVDEYTASGDLADPGTRRPVLTIEHEQFEEHNGGQLQFGPDGYLYVSTGDGGCCSDPLQNGQDLGSLLGKLLRIDPRPSGGSPYSVPADNPFVGGPGADEIWAYGLRNPWRFSFDRATGDLVIGDVGEALWEEIDYMVAPNAGRGLNFGWPCREGRHAFSSAPACAGATFAEPVLEYPHPAQGCSSVTGGYVARDPALGELYGRYLYADFCTDELRSARLALPAVTDDRSEGVPTSGPVSFGEDACGRLYLASRADDMVFRLGGVTASQCEAASPPAEPPRCRGEAATIVAERARRVVGTRKADVIVGTAAADAIRSRGGDDTICGRGRGDRLAGGGGADVLSGGPGADRLHGGRGADRCRGGRGADRVRGCQGAGP